MALLLTIILAASAAGAADEAAASPPAPQQQVLRPYTINPGDEIEVYVWGEDRLQRTIRILPDGTFSFPLVGKVFALGQSPSQIEDVITKGLASQYRGQVPQVTVSVRSPSGFQFTVAGKVKGPGTFSPGRYVNLIEALSYAGGPDEFASLDGITILRKSGNNLVAIRARISSAYKGGAAAREITASSIPQIESGDTVIVP
ncbi:polysaccharide biosynthesis/export family protein [Aquisediminimonas profunda]|uniref:polysaccharide biosynthesis/export family protein n=1 Tax=Aquisediminimonas profunda TaxID=1550733 RepID=UPI001C62F720|nr:polysaccharide biosynthesis/export family protein [Aquisediminimonas profunda]